jgi:hypothetical protein
MFVRWQRRKRRDGVTRLNAVLCESRRVDGKPRQEHVAYLAAIDDVWLEQPADDPDANLARHEFWEKAEKRLGPLGNRLAPEDHHKIRDQLNAKVPMADRDAAWKHYLKNQRTVSAIKRCVLLHDEAGNEMTKMRVEEKEQHIGRAKTGLKIQDMALDRMQTLLGAEGEEYEHIPVEDEIQELLEGTAKNK